MSAEKLRELKTLASVCPELNLANYTEDDVRHLNDWAIEMSLLVERYALSQQPDNTSCKSVQKRHHAQQPATPDPIKLHKECATMPNDERCDECQQPATAIACGIPGMAKTTCPYCEQGFAFEHEQPATGEPGAWSERELLRHAQAAVVMPMIGPLLDAWENSDREVMSQEPELSKQLKNINSAMEDADTHPAPSVPDGYVLAPIEPTDEMMSEMLGPFIAINGDNRSAFIEAYPRMLTAAMLAAKDTK